jgi:hypothetical protein
MAKDKRSVCIKKLEKASNERVIVTTRIRGTLKKRFYTDALDHEIGEGDLAACILKVHYAIKSEFPSLAGMDYTEVKKMDIETLRACVVKILKPI